MASIGPLSLIIISHQPNTTMNPPNNELPPLKNIEKSGTYILKLIKPKDEKINERFKTNKRGFSSCRLFFVDGDGNCMTKNYSVEFGKGLAMLVGKYTGKFSPEPSKEMSVEMLIQYVSPAFGRKANVELDVTPDKEWNGRMQFNYKMTKIVAYDEGIYGSAPEASEDVPF